MDPNAVLRRIDDADRVDADTRDAMRSLHGWLSGGGFEPDWDAHPTGTRRYRKTYGKRAGARIRGASRPRAHAMISEIGVGDIVQRSDASSRNRYVVVEIQGPWIYAQRISGSGGPGVITFPSALMLKKVVV